MARGTCEKRIPKQTRKPKVNIILCDSENLDIFHRERVSRVPIRIEDNHESIDNSVVPVAVCLDVREAIQTHRLVVEKPERVIKEPLTDVDAVVDNVKDFVDYTKQNKETLVKTTRKHACQVAQRCVDWQRRPNFVCGGWRGLSQVVFWSAAVRP